MRRAIEEAAPDGTLVGASRATEHALIRRGLAVPVYGIVTRPNRYSRTAQTVYGAYLGARLIRLEK